MSDNNEVIIPKEMAQFEWVWVLSSPMSKKRDSIFVLDMEEKSDARKRRILPIFETREDAAKMKLRLLQSSAGEYSEHAITLQEVGQFAAKNEIEIMMLDENGNIMAHMEAHVEKVSLH